MELTGEQIMSLGMSVIRHDRPIPKEADTWEFYDDELIAFARSLLAASSTAKLVNEETMRLASVALRESAGSPIVQDWQEAALKVCRAVLASIPPNTPVEAGKLGFADGVMASDGSKPE